MNNVKLTPVLVKNVKPISPIESNIYPTKHKNRFIDKKGTIYRKVIGVNIPYYSPVGIMVSGDDLFYWTDESHTKKASVKETLIDVFVDKLGYADMDIDYLDGDIHNTRVSNLGFVLVDSIKDRYREVLLSRLDETPKVSIQDSQPLSEPKKKPRKYIDGVNSTRNLDIIIPNTVIKVQVDPTVVVRGVVKSEECNIFARNELTDVVYFCRYYHTLKTLIGRRFTHNAYFDEPIRSRCYKNGWSFSKTFDSLPVKSKVYIDMCSKLNVEFGTHIYQVISSISISEPMLLAELRNRLGFSDKFSDAKVISMNYYNGNEIRSVSSTSDYIDI